VRVSEGAHLLACVFLAVAARGPVGASAVLMAQSSPASLLLLRSFACATTLGPQVRPLCSSP